LFRSRAKLMDVYRRRLKTKPAFPGAGDANS
jgi:hypothetical protein